MPSFAELDLSFQLRTVSICCVTKIGALASKVVELKCEIALDEKYSIRDAIHGFVKLNQLEWDIINQPCFQRLRRVRQLGWTDYVYPGAMHTRFEHSIGVMAVATRLFERIVEKDKELLRSEYQLNDAGFARQRQLIRLAALTHDLGHAPFSHAAEELFPINKKTKKRYKHEEYSAFIAKSELSELIKNHPANKNYNLSIDDIVSFFSPSEVSAEAIIWRELIAGQMDADRMDYLLRDAHHSGVSYGRYDLDRLVESIRLCPDGEGNFTVGIDESGLHAVEGLIIARYMMFTQVYFHKTRSIYDFHYEHALTSLLNKTDGIFPSPKKIKDYIKWDDWKVLGKLAAGEGGENGRIIRERNHHRLVYWTSEVPTELEANKFADILQKLSNFSPVVRDANKSWYKFSKDEIRVKAGNMHNSKSEPLANRSPVVNGLSTINQQRLYVPFEHQKAALNLIN